MQHHRDPPDAEDLCNRPGMLPCGSSGMNQWLLLPAIASARRVAQAQAVDSVPFPERVFAFPSSGKGTEPAA
jgi:hypothetical protein